MRLPRPSPVVQFAVSGLAAMVIVGAVGVAVTREIGTKAAIDDAKRLTTIVGKGIVGPAMTPAVLAGDERAVSRLDRLVHARVLQQGIVRVKVWDHDGR